MNNKNKNKFFLSLSIPGLFLLIGVGFFIIQNKESQNQPSIELTLNSFSPNGSGGGVMIPASCESGYTNNNDICPYYTYDVQCDWWSGECSYSNYQYVIYPYACSNGACDPYLPATYGSTYVDSQCLSLVTTNSWYCTDNGCAALTCVGSSCFNDIATVPGTMLCDNGCAANTCVGEVCWNSYAWVNGTDPCHGQCVAYPTPLDSAPTSLCVVGNPSSVSEAAFEWTWTCAGTAPGSTMASCSATKNCGTINYNFVYNENAAEVCLEGACGVTKEALYSCIKSSAAPLCGSQVVDNSFCGTPNPPAVQCPACNKRSIWREIAD